MNISRTVPISRTHTSGDAVLLDGRRFATCRQRRFNARPSTSAAATRAGQNFSPEMTMGMESGMQHDPGTLPMVGVHQQVGSNVFGRLDTHASTHEMMQVGHGGHPGINLHMPAWTGMMPDMGPDQPPEMFGAPHTMTPTSLRHTYFGQEALEMTREIHSGLPTPMISPMHYQDFAENPRRGLPFRGPETGHPPMLSTQDVSMEMMAGHFY